MTGTLIQKRKGYLVIGGIGVFLASGYLGMSIQLPLGQLEQPGAAVFPLVTGALFLMGSLATLWEGWKMEQFEDVEIPKGSDLNRLLGMIVSLLGYFLALPWLGQFISSLLFCAILMRMLSRLNFLRVMLYSALIAGVLHAVFVYLLEVPMPRGILFI